MANRNELMLRAAAVNINPASYPNDSNLEQRVIFAEKALTASAAATTLLPNAAAVQGVSGGANV